MHNVFHPSMPHRLLLILADHHHADVMALLTTLFTTIASTIIISGVPDAEQTEVRLALFPLIGSLLATTAMWLLAPSREDRRRVFGRCIYSVACGVAITVIACYTGSWGEFMAAHPFALMLSGMAVATFVYAIARATAERAMARADYIAEKVVDAVEHETVDRLNSSRKQRSDAPTKTPPPTDPTP